MNMNVQFNIVRYFLMQVLISHLLFLLLIYYQHATGMQCICKVYSLHHMMTLDFVYPMSSTYDTELKQTFAFGFPNVWHYVDKYGSDVTLTRQGRRQLLRSGGGGLTSSERSFSVFHRLKARRGYVEHHSKFAWTGVWYCMSTRTEPTICLCAV